MRSKSITIAGRLSYREALITLWEKHPKTNIEDARRITGAPKRTALKVRNDLVLAGKLKAQPEATRKEWL